MNCNPVGAGDPSAANYSRFPWCNAVADVDVNLLFLLGRSLVRCVLQTR